VNILAIGAHPDDLELMCAGTLARYAATGHKVIMCYATNGNMGHMTMPPSELAQLRMTEAKRAASTVGADFEWINLPDEWVFEDEDTRRVFVDVVRKHQPQVVITHSASDYHPDHRAVYNLVFSATFLATVPQIGGPFETLAAVPSIYCMDTLGGFAFTPEQYVDITGVFDVKAKALAEHESQVRWLQEHDGIDVLDWMRVTSEFRGLQAGCRYAEAFVLEKRWPAVPAQRQLP